MGYNNRETGSRYEREIAAYLEKREFVILEKNYRCRSGEIDLIARDGRYLVFIEVKYRKSGAAGTALEAISPKKVLKVRQTAAYYLYEKGLPEDTPCRFDAAGVDGETVTYRKDAF